MLVTFRMSGETLPRAPMGYSLGLAGLKTWSLGLAVVAEFLGTMLLVLIGCGAAINWKTGLDVTQVGGGE